MFSRIIAGTIAGIEALPVYVEVDISTGLPGVTMVGSLSGEVREAKERVMIALKNGEYDLPPQRITVNLSPGDLRKEGTGFDLPIAVGLLRNMGYFMPDSTEDILFIGELGLNGEVKKVNGVLPVVEMARSMGLKECIVPWENRIEASVIPGIGIRACKSLLEIVTFLQADSKEKENILPPIECITEKVMEEKDMSLVPDFCDIYGQHQAKRAAEIAAAGFHNLLMWGPPGGGKSMIAKAISGILPDMNWQECIEVSKIYSVAGKLNDEHPLITTRPYQNPHHTIPTAALVGGGIHAQPGAISLAHRGVLFLDEIPEFPRNILECLRQPLEDKKVEVIRLQQHHVYPANFMMIGAMNPCKCGFYPDRNRCRCTEKEIQGYRSRLSGPLLDRVDLFVETQKVELTDLQKNSKGFSNEENSESIRKRVEKARKIQEERFRQSKLSFNADMQGKEISRYCILRENEEKMMEEAYKCFEMSARSYHRVIKVARTIADLAGEENIREEHLLEALMYRMQI